MSIISDAIQEYIKNPDKFKDDNMIKFGKK